MPNVPNPIAWNPSDTTGGLLSNSNLTFTANAGNSHALIRAGSGYNSGLIYWEVSFNGIGFVFNCCAGLTTQAATVANIEATGLNAVLIMHYGGGHQAQKNGTSLWQNALGNYIGICGFAVNLNTKRIWMRPTPTDSWNNDVTADPVAGINGIDISFFGSTLVIPFAQGYNAAAEPVWVLNAGQSAFAGVVPTGFDAGWNNPIICSGCSGGIFPLGTYRVLFTQSGNLDDLSGPALSISAGVGHGGHPSGNVSYFCLPVSPAVNDTIISWFDTQAVNSAGPGTALQNWTTTLDGVDVSAQVIYDGFGTASWEGLLASGPHALRLLNIVQLSAGSTYMGTAIPLAYKTDVITISLSALALPLPTGLHSTAITNTAITMAWTAPTGTAPTNYTLQYKRSIDLVWTPITGITSTSQAVTGLTAGTSYDFQVAGVYGVITNDFTSTVTVVTTSIMGNPAFRAFSLVAGVLTQETTLPITASRIGIAQSGETIWLLGPIAVPMMRWSAPFHLKSILSGRVSIYNGTSFTSAIPGVEHMPSAVAWDASGHAWAATTENDLYEISATGSLIAASVLPPYGNQESGVPLGISALSWWTGHLYGASAFNGLLVKAT